MILDELATISTAAGSLPRPLGYHSWHDLLFLHWCVPSELVEAQLPPGVTLDTWQGQAMIGLVAFRMSGSRPWWFPPIWHLSAFPETNVRTYVRCGDEEPGVWFFSLDAARLAPVLIARRRWHLNYHWAQMRVARTPGRVSYSSRRFGRDAAYARIEAHIGSPATATCAQPSTLEHFLLERYVFYNLAPGGRLQQGRVRHPAYALAPARIVKIDQSLLAASAFHVSGPPCHVAYSPGVDVEIASLRDIAV
jgi:uncharacterized protein